MLAPMCGVLGTVIGVVLGLVVAVLTSAYDAYADGVRSGCVAAGACATCNAEPFLGLFIFMSYLLGTVLGILFLIAVTINCAAHARTRHTPPEEEPRRGRSKAQ